MTVVALPCELLPETPKTLFEVVSSFSGMSGYFWFLYVGEADLMSVFRGTLNHHISFIRIYRLIHKLFNFLESYNANIA